MPPVLRYSQTPQPVDLQSVSNWDGRQGLMARVLSQHLPERSVLPHPLLLFSSPLSFSPLCSSSPLVCSPLLLSSVLLSSTPLISSPPLHRSCNSSTDQFLRPALQGPDGGCGEPRRRAAK